MSILFKIIFMIFLNSILFFPLPCWSQSNSFEFKGHVLGANMGKIQLLIEPTNDREFVKLKQEIVQLNNGYFNFKGEILYPYLTRIIINDSIFSAPLFIEPGIVKGEFILDSIGQISAIVQSKTNSEYLNNYLPKVKQSNTKLDEWYETHYKQNLIYNDNIPSHIEDSMFVLKRKVLNEIDSLNHKYISNNNKSFVGFWDLANCIFSGGYTEIRYKSFYELDIKLQNTYTGKFVKKLLENEKKVLVGSNFPNIILVNSSEKKHSILNLLSAEFTLLDFWYSYCGPCIGQFSKLSKLYSAFNKSDFQILGISVDQKNDKFNWLKTIKEYKLSWPQFWDVNKVQALRLGINSYPQNFIVDRGGRIVAKNLNVEQIDTFLHSHLH